LFCSKAKVAWRQPPAPVYYGQKLFGVRFGLKLDIFTAVYRLHPENKPFKRLNKF
jgi:hypothetical protein